MNEQGLVSSYALAQFEPQKTHPNEEQQRNELNRQFTQEKPLSVIVSDLTYVRVNKKWHYICVFLISLIKKLSVSVIVQAQTKMHYWSIRH
ncbi:hypothetical protein CHH83_16290 [Bacillus sp. 7586-K]|nr:hypothetical protein CHH83_16290 [Bacillus sp. 7586-K]